MRSTAKLRSCIRMLPPYRPAAETLVFCPDRCMLFSVLASLCMHTRLLCTKALHMQTKKAHLHCHDLELTDTHHRHRGRFQSVQSDERHSRRAITQAGCWALARSNAGAGRTNQALHKAPRREWLPLTVHATSAPSAATCPGPRRPQPQTALPSACTRLLQPSTLWLTLVQSQSWPLL